MPSINTKESCVINKIYKRKDHLTTIYSLEYQHVKTISFSRLYQSIEQE